MSSRAEADAIRRLHAQYETARALAESASLAEAAPRILKALGQTLGFDHGAVWTVDQADTSIRCLDTWHAPSQAFAEFDAVTRAMVFMVSPQGLVASTRAANTHRNTPKRASDGCQVRR